jgi:hypothetical protein
MFCFHAKAQDDEIKPLINAWKVADTSQTHRAEKTYEELKLEKDSRKFQRKIHNNRRL